MTPPRAVDLARLTVGALALARPQTLLKLSPGDDSAATGRVVGVRGARTGAHPAGGALPRRPWVPADAAGVDVVHAASMAGIATLAPSHRRLALTSLVAALTFAAVDLRDHQAPSTVKDRS